MQNAALPFRAITDNGGQHRAEATESPRPGEPRPLDYRPPGDETIDDYDHRHYEQEMDQRASDVESQEPQNPKDEENYRDGPKH
jgi:hypothetical protein